MPYLNYCANISLRTGTLIIAGIGFFWACLDFLALMLGVLLVPHLVLGTPFTVIVEVVHIIISSLLFFGTIMRKPMWLLPYVVGNAILIGLVGLVALVALFTGIIAPAIALLIALSIYGYLTLVVYSYYQFLQEGEGQSQIPPPYNATTPLTTASQFMPQSPFQPQLQSQPYYPSEQEMQITTEHYPQK